MPVTSLDWIALIKYDFLAKGTEKCELLGLSAVLGEFSCEDCIVTCSIGKWNVFWAVLVPQNRNTFQAHIYAK